MDWREKSVTLGNVQKERFNTHLAHVTVSETRITVAYKDVDDWKRIRREVGTDILLEQVAIEDIRDIDTSEEHLYYPHINLTVETDEGTEEKRIYFMEGEEDDLHACQNAINRFWNAHRQRGAPRRDSYEYGEESGEDDERTEEEEGAEEEAGEAEAEAPVEPGEPADMEEVELTTALKQQNSITHRLSEGIKNEAAHFKQLLTRSTDDGAGEAEDAETGTEEQPPETDDEGEEEEKKGLMEKISDEYRAEIDRFRHIGKDGTPKDGGEEGEAEDEGTDGDEEDTEEETKQEARSAVDEVVDRLEGQ